MPSIAFEKELKELFVDLHRSRLIPDGKIISDATFTMPPQVLLTRYRAEKRKPGFDLATFFTEHFETPVTPTSGYQSDPNIPVDLHIERLWPLLTRQPSPAATYTSRIPLPHPYVVPGGRFNEIYYWDSYFTMLGLQTSGRVELIHSMVDNFAYLIDTFGFIPNGNRTYFLSRSQPPFFSLMVRLLASEKDSTILITYRQAMEKEYNFWMQEGKRMIKTRDNQHLNRFFDNHILPRTEMYLEDVELLVKRGEAGEKLLLDIRAACESGWDFSSRWCMDPLRLETIRTTDLLPVDLNCLLWHLEDTLAEASQLQKDETQSRYFSQKADQRQALIQKYFWNTRSGFFHDFDLITEAHTSSIHAAGLFPLFFNLATKQQADRCAEMVREKLLADGGLLTTSLESGQQWDAPNGWAPLQWIAYRALKNYEHHELAASLRTRWITLNKKVFKNTGKLMEKYNVLDPSIESGGGEYPNQDGFGWTNGVLLKLLREQHNTK